MFDFSSGLSLTKNTDALRSVKSLNIIFEDETIPKEEKLVRDIDGGWAFVILATSVFGHVFVFGVVMSNNIFYTVILEYDLGGGPAMTMIPFAFTSSLVYLLSPLSNWLRRRCGSRITILIGVIFSSGGLITSSFVINVTQFTIAYGIMCGVGWSLIYTVLIIHLEDFFVIHRNSVTMCVSTGVGFSSFIYPLITSALILRYGWRGAFFICGALNLNLLICVAAFRKNEFTEQLRTEEYRSSISQSAIRFTLPKRKSFIVKCVMCHHLHNWRFLLVLLSHFLIGTGTAVCVINLANVPKALKLNDQTTALSVSLFGLGSSMNRVVLSLAAHYLPWCICTMYEIIVFFFGISMLLFAFSVNGAMLIFSSVCLGLTSCWFIMSPELIFLTVGPSNFNSGFSAILFVVGLATFVALPVSGFIYEISNSYTIVVSAGGLLSMASSLAIIPIWIEYTFC